MKASAVMGYFRGVEFPVLRHEMRIRQRGARPFIVMFAYVAVLAIAVLLVLNVSSRLMTQSANMQDTSQVGRLLFSVLLFTQLVMITLVVPTYSAASVASERDKGTLQLLVLTLLSSSEITMQKLVAAFAQALMLAMVSLPVLGMVFLLGGVSPLEVVLGYALLIMLAATLSSLGTMCSCYFRNARTATFVTYLSALIFLAGVPFLNQLLPNLMNNQLGSPEFFAFSFVFSLMVVGGAFAGMAYALVGTVVRRRFEDGWRVRAIRMSLFGGIYCMSMAAFSTGTIASALCYNDIFLPLYVNPFFALSQLVNNSAGYRSFAPVDWAVPATLLFSAGCAYLFKLFSTARFEMMRRSEKI